MRSMERARTQVTANTVRHCNLNQACTRGLNHQQHSHEDACQIQLHLESNVHIGTVDCGAPPQREAAVGDLIQTTALCIGELLVLHGLFKPAGLHTKGTQLCAGDVVRKGQSVKIFDTACLSQADMEMCSQGVSCVTLACKSGSC